MPNLMQRGATWLGSKLQTAAGRAVVITQSGTRLEITAWHAKHEYEVIDEQGLRTKVASFDWSIVAADLEGLELHPGALITDGESVYEATPIGNRQCVENMDSSGIMLLLHTRQVT